MGTLNLGIVAHVDAGKTTLTERLLYAAGVIDAVGSVDAGTTRTDYMELERRRGITIRAAVAAFTVGDVTVNIIDTPGHPDFIAEVERSLAVLDGAVLVVSAVEGVQAQTVILMRALRRLEVPTVIFVNKIDRTGADVAGTLAAIRDRLTRSAAPLGSVDATGTAGAAFARYQDSDRRLTDTLTEVLIDVDDEFLAAVADGPSTPQLPRLWSRFVQHTAMAQVHPVLYGSAITGAGVDDLMEALPALLPLADGEASGSPSGVVFKIERAAKGEKVAYVRMFTGELAVRDRVDLAGRGPATVTSLRVFEHGSDVDHHSVRAGQIAKVTGLREASVGDVLGAAPRRAATAVFAPPMLETAVVARDRSQKAALHTALSQLAEQDPFINLRQDDVRQELFLSLYGEVQKEVVEQTVLADYAIAVDFRETTTICVERVAGRGQAVELMRRRGNPFLATIGLAVEPGPRGSGIQFALDIDVKTIPLYVYKTVDAFADAMAGYIRDTLQQGLLGWEVSDCHVTMTQSDYIPPGTGSGDYRKLTPLVVMAALKQAGTKVYEPVQQFRLEAPTDSLSSLLRLLGSLGGVPDPPITDGAWCTVTGGVAASKIHRFRQQLKGLTRGEGVLDAHFDHYQPVADSPPRRARTDNNPLNRKQYLLNVLGHPV